MRRIDGSDLHYLREKEGRDSVDYYTAVREAAELVADELSPLSKVRVTEEVFDAPDGSRRPIGDIVKVLGGRQIDLTQDGARIADGGFRNAATARDQLRGKYLADVSVNPSAIKAGVAPMRAMDVDKWAQDPVARAFALPETVDFATASPEIKRAAQMGAAASQGDRAAVKAAQKRYSFTDDEVREFLSMTKIGGQGFGSSIRKSGLDEGRAGEVIHPDTGLKVAGSPEENQFYEDRQVQLTRDWLEGGGTGFNDPKSFIAIPGNNYQMEHDSAFSTTNEYGLAETPLNRAGFLERYVNSEKSDIDPTTYYQTQRLHLLGHDAGVKLTGVMKGDSSEATLRGILERDNPSVTQTGERLIKDRTDIYHPEKAALNQALIDKAMTPVYVSDRNAGDTLNIKNLKETGPGDINIILDY